MVSRRVWVTVAPCLSALSLTHWHFSVVLQTALRLIFKCPKVLKLKYHYNKFNRSHSQKAALDMRGKINEQKCNLNPDAIFVHKLLFNFFKFNSAHFPRLEHAHEQEHNIYCSPRIFYILFVQYMYISSRCSCFFSHLLAMFFCDTNIIYKKL